MTNDTASTTAPPVTIVEFLTARLDEAEENVQSEIRFSKLRGRDLKDWGKYVYDPVIGPYGGQSRLRDAATGIYIAKAADPTRVLAVIAAHRAIIELHKQWPILVEGPTKFDQTDASGPDPVVFKMSRQIAWATEQEYRNRFGDEPPTAPMMRALASIWSDHEDYRQEWKS